MLGRVLIRITTGLPAVDVFELAERHPPIWPNIDPDLDRPSSESSSGCSMHEALAF